MISALLDTNVLIDYMVPDRPCSQEAATIIEAVGSGKINAVVAASSLKELYYITRKHFSDDIVRSYITAFMELMEVAPVDSAACACALASDEPDFEDGIIRAIGESMGVDFIITRDEKAFKNSKMRAVSSSLLVQLLA